MLKFLLACAFVIGLVAAPAAAAPVPERAARTSTASALSLTNNGGGNYTVSSRVCATSQEWAYLRADRSDGASNYGPVVYVPANSCVTVTDSARSSTRPAYWYVVSGGVSKCCGKTYYVF